MAAFKIGINMAGAISAGAYTAGVLDFLTEALEEWYKAKERGEAVPGHDVCIEVLAGASAGGMCAAISAVMLQEHFEHIHDTSKRDTTNRFYESWVNKIDIRELLGTDDLKNAPPVVSLLDSTIITKIAAYALTPATGTSTPPPPYISPDLTLFLSLTNLRGIPYSLNGAAPGSAEETTLFFGDRIRFETSRKDKINAPAEWAYTLDTEQPGTSGWQVLRTAATATGAFPIFLAPRVLERKCGEYTPPMWESVVSATTGTPPPVPPNFPSGMAESLVTLNVDGGVTNNDPFNYAHDYLASRHPAVDADRPGCENASMTDRAVISIAPFPSAGKFEPTYHPEREAGIFTALTRLFSALIAQSRFFGESLDQIMRGTTFNRFVVAPSDQDLSPENHRPALQCAALGAFGGFFERGFRAHDYALGRRNCQKFLRDYFVLPEDNVIVQPALASLTPEVREAVLKRFRRPAPGTYAESEAVLDEMGKDLPGAQKTAADLWIPIIPLCSETVSQEIGPVERATVTSASLDEILTLILSRMRAMMPVILREIPFAPLRVFLQVGQPFIRFLARRPLRDALVKGLGDSYVP